jgi:hypothetical protein
MGGESKDDNIKQIVKEQIELKPILQKGKP